MNFLFNATDMFLIDCLGNSQLPSTFFFLFPFPMKIGNILQFIIFHI